MYYQNWILDSKMAPIQSHENFSPGTWAKKVFTFQVWFCVVQPTEYRQYFLLRLKTLHWSDVTDFKILFPDSRHFYKHKTSIDLKSNTWPYFPFEVSCRQFYRHLIYNGGLWGKCDLGHKGFFMLQYRSYPPGEIDSKAVRWRRIQFS